MEDKTSIWKIALNYGAIAGLSLVILTTIWYVLDLSFNSYVGWLNYAALIAIILAATKKQREFDNDIISYGKALGVGSVVSIIAGVVLAVFTYLLYSVIDVDLINKLYAMQEQAMMTEASITDEQIEASMEMVKKFTSPAVISVGAFFGTGFVGFIISLITSAVLKKNIEL